MSKAPEQSIVDQLEAAGYQADAIIAYLEARVEKEWASLNFAECAQGERMVFGVCRKVDGEAPKAEEPKPQQPKPQEKPQGAFGAKTAQEEKLEKAAKAQGSSPDNNKKVMIDGKAYGWAIKGGKPIMVEWGSVAGIKKVGAEKAGKGGGAGGDNAGRIAGLKKALEKQTTEAGRRAIQKQIDELSGGSRSGSSTRGAGGGGSVETLAQRARDAWSDVPKEGRTPANAARYATAIATAQAADKALREAERAAMPPQRGRRQG